MDYAEILTSDIRQYGISSPRSAQSRAGILGPSDLGFCRQKASLVTKGVERTDEISITPDIIAPDWNAIIDVKTVDGFEWVRRSGTSLNHKYQRHTYALAAIQQGYISHTDDNPALVGNLYIDRSGKEATPLLLIEEFDPTLTDVIYAVKNGEDAMRDVGAPVCERICEFFSVCRGGLEVREGGIYIEDDNLLAAVDMYNEARDMEKRAKQMKDEAGYMLSGVNGTTGEWNVRWVEVQPARVEAFDKKGYMRIDIRKARK